MILKLTEVFFSIYEETLRFCGLQGQGKGLLRQLLDGHSVIFSPGFICCPGISLLGNEFLNYLARNENINKGGLNLFSNCFARNAVTIKYSDRYYSTTVGDIWKYLFRKEFYGLLIDYSHADWASLYSKNFKADLKGSDFDFVQFLNSTIDEIARIGEFNSVEHLQETIYRCCIKSYNSFPTNFSEDSYFFTSSFGKWFFLLLRLFHVTIQIRKSL